MKKTSETVTIVHTNRQRFFGILALCGLFLCGLLVGFLWNHSENRIAQLSAKQCAKIQDKIDGAIRDADLEKLEKLQLTYMKSCVNVVVNEAQTADKTNQNVKTCEKIEMLLSEDLNPVESTNVYEHENNVRVYQKLIEYGCSENQEKYAKLMQSEQQILTALRALYPNETDAAIMDMRPCEVIEQNLKGKIEPCTNCSYDTYLNNAEAYSTMAEKGCPENSQQYKQLALGQLEIATALARQGQMEEPENAQIVIDTYKKLQMQNEARKVLDKVQKLTNPAIDFILQMEAIINE